MAPAITIAALWVGWWISWMMAAFWSARTIGRPAVGSQFGYRLLTVVGAFLLFRTLDQGPRAAMMLWRAPVVVQWVMAALVLVGLLFTWWARVHLGRFWSGNVTRKADHHVVDSGPYGIVRHPIYTGIILASFATAAASGSALAWLGAAIMTLGWIVKARLEERFLRDQLGAQAYDDYARRVPMLMPGAAHRGPR
jgi:protein-S-isoprenylcysteine O-methyltransferase Ste14